VLSTPLGSTLVDVLMKQYLFNVPEDAKAALNTGASNDAVCNRPHMRRKAYDVLVAYSKAFSTMDGESSPFDQITTTINKLLGSASQLRGGAGLGWGLEVSGDVKKSDIPFSGLKNQGCTCYANSLLQQLYLNTEFRHAILNAPLLESHRRTLWHRSDAELVGVKVLLGLPADAPTTWVPYLVKSCDADKSTHTLEKYVTEATALGGVAITAPFSMEVNLQRFKDHGNIRIAPKDGEETTSQEDLDAYHILEQLQRTFAYLKFSNQRFYDPRNLVEACKTLKMEFSVYRQNDAAEFFDKLFDRLEIATKGKHTGNNVWRDIQSNIFGGELLYQKIPKMCPAFDTKKEECGHFQGMRTEPSVKVELQIRGKDHIDHSLSDYFQGELMEGDNAIQCDVCQQKKDTVRRTCMGKLPKTMVLHLKRFDLDYNTFETVKLNNRMEFPLKLNFFPYTKEGFDQRDAEAAGNVEDGENNNVDDVGAPVSSPSSSPRRHPVELEVDNTENTAASVAEAIKEVDLSDYEYEFQGALVHAGVANGGHYYSFARGPGDSWYRLDDDDVTSFDSENIPYQCFGGPQGQSDIDRSANALILFYNKIKPITSSEAPVEKKVSPGAGMVNGYDAFVPEVQNSNMLHVLSCYLLDADLHDFLCRLLSASAENSMQTSSDDSTLKSCIRLFVQVILHKSDHATKLLENWQTALQKIFEARPKVASWFVSQLVLDELGSSDDTWTQYFFTSCTDNNSRAAFASLVVAAVKAIAPISVEGSPEPLSVYMGDTIDCSGFKDEVAHAGDSDAALLCVTVLVDILAALQLGVTNPKLAADLFTIVRDLAAVPSLRWGMLALDIMIHLAWFADPTLEPLPKSLRDEYALVVAHRPNRTVAGNAGSAYHVQNDASSRKSADERDLLLVVFECMAALSGVRQMRPATLLVDKPNSHWDQEPTSACMEVLKTIFSEIANIAPGTNVRGLDSSAAKQHLEREEKYKKSPSSQVTNGARGRSISHQTRAMFQKYPAQQLPDGRLSLSGFVQYYVDLCVHTEEPLWHCFKAYGYRNDLSRMALNPNFSATSISSVPETSSVTVEIIDVDEEFKESEDVLYCAAPAVSTVLVEGDSVEPIDDAELTFRNTPSASTMHTNTTQLASSNRYLDDSEYPSVPVSIVDLSMSPVSAAVLSCAGLYASGMSAAPVPTKNLAQSACFGNSERTISLVNSGLMRLLYATKDMETIAVDASLDLLMAFLEINDDLKESRGREILSNSDAGLLTVIQNEKVRPTRCSVNAHDNTLLRTRYCGYLSSLCVDDDFLALLMKMASEDSVVRSIHRHLKLNGQDFSAVETDRMEKAVVNVEGSGLATVNGLYTFAGIQLGAAMYERYAPFTNMDGSVMENARYVIYICEVKNHAKQWFVSIVKEGSKPGTSADIDLYYALEEKRSSLVYGRTLPPLVWNNFGSSPKHFSPPPSIHCSWTEDELDPMSPQNTEVREPTVARVTSLTNDYVTNTRNVNYVQNNTHSSASEPVTAWDVDDDDLYGYENDEIGGFYDQ
jgi:ubiquitin C-terminal hydrolase